MPRPSRPMRATEGGGLRRRSGRLPPAARSAVASRGAARRERAAARSAGRPRPGKAPRSQRVATKRCRFRAGAGRPRAVAGEPGAPGRRRQAPREPRAILQGPSLGSRLPPSFLLGALRGFRPRLRPLGSRRPHAGPIGGDDRIDGRTPRASRALRARRAGPSPGFLRMKAKARRFLAGLRVGLELAPITRGGASGACLGRAGP